MKNPNPPSYPLPSSLGAPRSLSTFTINGATDTLGFPSQSSWLAAGGVQSPYMKW